jgi:hypothetical protein
MTSNKVAVTGTERPILFKPKVPLATDDVNTESYHTSGIILFLMLFYFEYNHFYL